MQKHWKETKQVTTTVIEVTCDICEKKVPTNHSSYVCTGCGVDLCNECRTTQCVDGFRHNEGVYDYFCKYCLRIMSRHKKLYKEEHKRLEEKFEKHRQSLHEISLSFHKKAEKAKKKRQATKETGKENA